MEDSVRKAINTLKTQSEFCRSVENAIHVLSVSANREDNPHDIFRCATKLFGSVIDTLRYRVSAMFCCKNVMVSMMCLFTYFRLLFPLPINASSGKRWKTGVCNRSPRGYPAGESDSVSRR